MLRFFDLPTHTLLVHAPVVLIPLTSIGAAAIALRPNWRRRYGWLVLAVAIAAFVSTLLAVSSGQAFDEFLDGAAPTARHAELGEQTRFLVLVLLAVVVVVLMVGRRQDRQPTADDRRRMATGIVLAVLTISIATTATVWVVMTGHEGARITWTGIFPDPGES